jgi:4-amino-4-deoxy-L-arabinose transferase-like glycosyltransferase
VLTSNDTYLSLDGLGSVAGRALGMGALLAVSQLGLLAAAVVAARRGLVAADEWLWLGGAVVGALLGLRFFGHYFLPVVPPLVLVASPALSRSWRHHRVALGLVVAAATVWIALAFVPDRVNPAQPYARASARIAALTEPGERIFNWGQVSQLYWDSDRVPAARFPHIGFLTGITGGRSNEVPYEHPVSGALDDLFADFAKHPPALIADSSSLLDRGDQYPLATSPIAKLVQHDYCVVDRVDGVDLWLRRELAVARAGRCA